MTSDRGTKSVTAEESVPLGNESAEKKKAFSVMITVTQVWRKEEYVYWCVLLKKIIVAIGMTAGVLCNMYTE